MESRQTVNTRYDRAMYEPLSQELYLGSDFHNLGFWHPDTKSLPEACENLVERLLEFVPQKTGMILDVACGKGATTRHLSKYYPPRSIVAINISTRQLRSGGENAPGGAFLAMDAARIGFADETFDTVLCVEAACHFNTREKFLYEAYRILKPGGRLVFSDLLIEAWMESLAPRTPGANYLCGPEEYRSLCRKVGYRQAEVLDVTEESWGPYARHYARFVGKKLAAGEVKRGTHHAAMAYLFLNILATRHYVIGWAMKS
jgi:ubiquinone/menaquinone biosynthesis C-methylase UbiE